MLAPHGKSYGIQQDDLSGSTDEDLLENTKPNLISYSLSTSSSNHTTVSAATNPECRDFDANIAKLPAEALMKLCPFERSEKSEGFSGLSVCNTSHVKNDAEMSLLISQGNSSEKINECCDTSTDVNLHNYSQTEIEDVNTSNNSDIMVYKNVMKRNFVSMSNLCNEDFSSNILPRFSSQPQLNIQVGSERTTLTRSSSTITLKNKKNSYEHIQSKVKLYIKHLKNEKESDKLSRKEEVIETSGVEDLLVNKLQQEIKRLQNHLEERDRLLQEVQANHHSLLLQYGEAKNRLDQLRFTSVRPQQGIMSVQTEPCVKENELTSLYLSNSSSSTNVSRENVHDVVNKHDFQYDSLSNHGDIQHNIKQQNVLRRNVSGDNPEVEGNIKHKLLAQNRESSSDMASLKVSTCTFLPPQPLPVPSCYGSLGSGESGSNHLENLKHISESFEKSPFADECVDYIATTNMMKQNGTRCLLDQSLKLEKPKYDVRRKESREKNECKEIDTYFLPIDKCNCWTPQNIVQQETLNIGLSENLVKSRIKDAISIPPLNLEYSEDSILQIPQNSIPNSPNSDFYNVSLSSQICNSSYSQNCSFFQNYNVDQTQSNNDYSFYMDTPTSYKSIVVNCVADEKGNVNKNLSQVPNSSSCDLHPCKNRGCCHDPLCDFQKKSVQYNWKKTNFQHPCCKRSSIHHTHSADYYGKCCYRDNALDHQLFRCEGCVSRCPFKYSNPEILSDTMHFLNNVSAYAEDLRKRTEAIQSFLTKLIDTASEI